MHQSTIENASQIIQIQLVWISSRPHTYRQTNGNNFEVLHLLIVISTLLPIRIDFFFFFFFVCLVAVVYSPLFFATLLLCVVAKFFALAFFWRLTIYRTRFAPLVGTMILGR
jgi:hypothetical protein